MIDTSEKENDEGWGEGEQEQRQTSSKNKTKTKKKGEKEGSMDLFGIEKPPTTPDRRKCRKKTAQFVVARKPLSPPKKQNSK